MGAFPGSGYVVDDSVRKAQREIALNVLRDGGKVLVVGGHVWKAFGALVDHPRVEVWDNDEMNRRSPIPANTRLVVLTRQINHAASEHVTTQTAKRNIHVFKTGNAQEARSLVEDAVGATAHPPLSNVTTVGNSPRLVVAAPKTEPQKPADPQKRTTAAKGSLTDFIVASGVDLSLPRIEVVNALCGLGALTRFPTTSRDSIGQSVYVLKKKLGIVEIGKPGGSKRIVEPPPQPELTVEPDPAPPIVVPPPALEPVVEDRRAKDPADDIVKLLDDAIEKLTSTSLALQLARDEVVASAEIRKENARLREKLRKILEE